MKPTRQVIAAAAALVFVVLALIVAPILAFGRELPAQVEDKCAAEGGCVWVSKNWMLERLRETADKAAAEGYKYGKYDANITFGKLT